MGDKGGKKDKDKNKQQQAETETRSTTEAGQQGPAKPYLDPSHRTPGR